MKPFLRQIKKRRLALGFKQSDMMLRIGVSRQQYQRLESKGNPRLETLELVAKGLNSELMLIPKEKLNEVRAVLEGANSPTVEGGGDRGGGEEPKKLHDDPWQGLLEDDQ